MRHATAQGSILGLLQYSCTASKQHVDLHFASSYCSAPRVLCPPCSHFASTGVIAANLPHDQKPLQSHSPTSRRLFVVVHPSISCSDSCNEVPTEANKTRDILDRHQLPLLDTQRNGTYNETEFTKESRGIWKERKK